ncbi:MAG: arginase family protein [Thermoprotei archaeon]
MFRKSDSRMIKDPRDVRISDIVRSSCEKNCVCIIGYPWDWTTAGRPGSRYAPSKIRDYFYSMNPLSDKRVCDPGDIDVVPGDLEASSLRLKNSIRKLCENCISIFIIGGDHSLTAVSVESLMEGFGLDRIGLLVFDAHFDLRKLSEGWSSGTYLRSLLEKLNDKVIPLIIGIRYHSNPLYMFEEAKKLGVKFITADEFRMSKLDTIFDKIDEVFSDVKNLYISVDMDSLDQSICMGVNSPSPGGLDIWDVIKVINHVFKGKRLVGGDIVEVVPLVDIGDSCARNAAYILYKMVYGTA